MESDAAPSQPTRRDLLGTLLALIGTSPVRGSHLVADEPAPRYRLTTFAADVTIPPGHPCMGGGIEPAREVLDPLEARGIVLLGADRPVVIVAVDWCEIRNDAYDRWREALAEAAGTTRERVLLASVHQHDAPVADLTAERLLREQESPASLCDLDFHERAVSTVAEALRAALADTHPVTHIGTGKAKVERIASNRRYLDAEGRPAFGRTSATRDTFIRDQPEGIIDPWLRALSFWNGETPLAVLNVYATHPMSYYGQGQVSADFIGMARRIRQADAPGVFQVYLSGCSGNVTAGKYNDGSPDNRAILAERLARAMAEAWAATTREPLGSVGFRTVPLILPPRDDEEFRVEALRDRLKSDPRSFGRCLAAMGLSYRARFDRGQPIDLPVLDLGTALYVVLPGEMYVEFQLEAQAMRPDAFVVVAGYGECATGYVPTEQAVREGDTNLRDWCWVAPGAEARVMEALRNALAR